MAVGGQDFRYFCMREDEKHHARTLSEKVADIGARLDRDPNGYCIARGGLIVARCPNLKAVEDWLGQEWRETVRADVPPDLLEDAR